MKWNNGLSIWRASISKTVNTKIRRFKSWNFNFKPSDLIHFYLFKGFWKLIILQLCFIKWIVLKLNTTVNWVHQTQKLSKFNNLNLKVLKISQFFQSRIIWYDVNWHLKWLNRVFFTKNKKVKINKFTVITWFLPGLVATLNFANFERLTI